MDKSASFDAGVVAAMEKVALKKGWEKVLRHAPTVGGALGGMSAGAIGGGLAGAATAKPGERGKGALRGAGLGAVGGAVGGGLMARTGKGGKYLSEMPEKAIKDISKGKNVTIDQQKILENLKKIDPGYNRRQAAAMYGGGALAGGLGGLTTRRAKKEQAAGK